MNSLPPSLTRFHAALEDAVRHDLAPAPRRHRGRRRILARVGIAGGAAAALALGVLSLASNHAPSVVAPASAGSAVHRAAAALAIVPDSVLHVTMVGTQQNADGSTVTWTDESWQQQAAPYDRRQIETTADGTVESATVSGVTQMFDPATNTIYVDSPPVQDAGRPSTNGAEPESDGFRGQILRLLRSGGAHTAGHPAIDGTPTVEIVSADGRMTYYVDPDTFQPVELDTTGTGGGTQLHFKDYEQSADLDLVSLAAQHPGATVDRDPADVQAAQSKLFPHG